MANSKEPQTSRPVSQHRLSVTSSPASAMAIRNTSARQHSHSVSLGTFNPDHRVTRRKSMNATAANNVGSLRAALNADENTPRSSNRRSLNLKNVGGSRGPGSTSGHGDRSSNGGSLTEASKRGLFANAEDNDESAIADDFSSAEQADSMSKARARRASEGSYLTKGDGKRSSGELRCDKCGKGYKHSSCLTKHLWEHTPEWSYTSKLLISKHQQVQLLEAASVLVGMNQEPDATPDITKTVESDHSSASPTASGSFDLQNDSEDYSSAETTPPPMSEQYGMLEGINTGRGKRHSGNSSSFSRSYQSAPSNSLPAGNGFTSMSSFSHYPSQRRPSTSGLAGPVDEEEVGLAAAVQSLCSFGTPRSGPVLLPPDVPPVPPLPARFVEQTLLQPPASARPQLVEREDVKMSNSQSPRAHEDYDHVRRSPSRSEDDDDGLFGKMEGVAHESHEEFSHLR